MIFSGNREQAFKEPILHLDGHRTFILQPRLFSGGGMYNKLLNALLFRMGLP
jgi:hypothetical protein